MKLPDELPEDNLSEFDYDDNVEDWVPFVELHKKTHRIFNLLRCVFIYYLRDLRLTGCDKINSPFSFHNLLILCGNYFSNIQVI
ncbi:MAG: hypothetical protein ACFFDN_38130 [Candidatus Hodarchaeota archaeon]